MTHWQHQLYNSRNQFEPCRTCKELTISEVLHHGNGVCPSCKKLEKSSDAHGQLRHSGNEK